MPKAIPARLEGGQIWQWHPAEFRSARDYVTPFSLAVSATAVDLHDEAIRFAQLAYEIRDPQLPVFAKHWPGITLLREDLRFAQILAGMGMK